ncbi:SDR family oxidoreductase [Desulfatibacillum aliphaticivorans]|uniref:SDR family oxidoreductase n=1 Tax=Desulfatibacillum aliphaticivorans TaxID=218208 RepID=UPI0004020E45|nr:SDR family oxidoreductase [Desulfatibacillum aliphaticivorans]
MKNLKGQLVLITGAGSGIGRKMAHYFAREGSRLVLAATTMAGLEKVASEVEELGAEARPYTVDVSDREQVYAMAGEIKKDLGKVDVLVNNAGVVSGKPFLECEDEQLERTLSVNVLGHFWTVKAFLPDMIEANHGHIVTMSSSAGWIGVNSLVDYSASKFANVGFDEAIRLELRKNGVKGVGTTCVCPFFTDTGMFDGVKTRYSFLLPILKEDEVAQRVVKAVKKGKTMLKMPPFTHTIPLLRVLPTAVIDFLAVHLGVTSSMDEFRGRVH